MASSKESDDTLKSEKKSNVFVPFDSGDEIELPKKEIYLLGECTHGTQEFYDIRAEISMELVRERGVKVLVFEADWSLMWRCNEYVHRKAAVPFDEDKPPRFPVWMWRNQSFLSFLKSLRKCRIHRICSVWTVTT